MDKLLVICVKSPFPASDIVSGRSGVVCLMILWYFSQTKTVSYTPLLRADNDSERHTVAHCQLEYGRTTLQLKNRRLIFVCIMFQPNSHGEKHHNEI